MCTFAFTASLARWCREVGQHGLWPARRCTDRRFAPTWPSRNRPGAPIPGPLVGLGVGQRSRHGVTLMSGPNPLPGPEAGEGNRFIYARTPWGLTVELISYPAPMAYEQHSEARRWRPMPTDR